MIIADLVRILLEIENWDAKVYINVHIERERDHQGRSGRENREF